MGAESIVALGDRFAIIRHLATSSVGARPDRHQLQTLFLT
jgi:hypothetical protein